MTETEVIEGFPAVGNLLADDVLHLQTGTPGSMIDKSISGRNARKWDGVLRGHIGVGIAASATVYIGPGWSQVVSVEAQAQAWSMGGRYDHFACYIDSAMPSGTLTFYLMKNGVQQAQMLQMTTAAGGWWGSSFATVNFVASDKLSIKVVSTYGSTSPALRQWVLD